MWLQTGEEENNNTVEEMNNAVDDIARITMCTMLSSYNKARRY